MLASLAVTPKDLTQCRLQSSHILLAGGIERLGDAGLVSTSWESKGADQRRIKADGGGSLAHRFGSSEHGHQEHLQLLDWGVLEHFLSNLHLRFQRLEKTAPTKLDA
jgi:hypothetical protein